LVYLMLVSAVPFATALLAEYIGKDAERDKVALVVYTSWQLLLSIMANVSLRYASFRGRLLKPGIDPAALRSWERLAVLGPVIWIAALLSALFLSGTITIVLMLVILLIFVQEAPGGSTEAAGETIAPAA